MGAFYRRIRARRGAPKAITATARKLAIQVYRMLKYGQAYVDVGEEQYMKRYREHRLKALKKRAQSLGFQILDPQTGVVVS